MALHILRSDRDLAEGLAKSLIDVKDNIKFCTICFNLTDDNPCPICSDGNRADGTICVVEGPGDQLAIEESGNFNGRYHVLHGVLSPLDGVGPEDLKIGELIGRLDKNNITTQVKSKLLDLLPSGHSTEEAVIQALHLSQRTLQRKLKEEGTTFKELLDETRRELAKEYVNDTSLSFSEITYLLGFSEQSNFTRAFKRWQGQSPSAYRQQVRMTA